MSGEIKTYHSAAQLKGLDQAEQEEEKKHNILIINVASDSK